MVPARHENHPSRHTLSVERYKRSTQLVRDVAGKRENRRLVGDYKTSGDLAQRADGTRMLKGLTLQVPLQATRIEVQSPEE